MSRGYFCIGLQYPKDRYNVGAVLRAAFVFGAGLVVTTGQRYRAASSDTVKAHRHLPLLQSDDLFASIPYDCVPVAIEVVDGAKPLPTYYHPERAFYIFGPEDGSLSKEIMLRCRDVVTIPSRGCLNLAAAVNVVLYDRESKRWPKRIETDTPLAALSAMA